MSVMRLLCILIIQQDDLFLQKQKWFKDTTKQKLYTYCKNISLFNSNQCMHL